MDLVKDRILVEGQKVRVYLNLNMMGRFSIQDFKSGLVVAYADSVLLKSVHFQVRKSGQEKARRENRRNVHAFAIGTYVSADLERPEHLDRVGYYNPFQVDHFVDELSQEPIHGTDLLFCQDKRVFYKYKKECIS